MDDAEIAEKLQILETTADHALRHSLALSLSDTRDARVFPVLLKLIKQPELKDRRGTLIYCLESYDCSSIREYLLELIETGNFEVAMQADIIIQEQGLR